MGLPIFCLIEADKMSVGNLESLEMSVVTFKFLLIDCLDWALNINLEDIPTYP